MTRPFFSAFGYRCVAAGHIVANDDFCVLYLLLPTGATGDGRSEEEEEGSIFLDADAASLLSSPPVAGGEGRVEWKEEERRRSRSSTVPQCCAVEPKGG